MSIPAMAQSLRAVLDASEMPTINKKGGRGQTHILTVVRPDGERIPVLIDRGKYTVCGFDGYIISSHEDVISTMEAIRKVWRS